ncbi:hypothetical protein C7B79_34935 [Chroococcidiopsis cubana CCALA 043]|nr:hypothetical protein C7B79_34935 [Chroococcidiopsis cubana CCALA 043]
MKRDAFMRYALRPCDRMVEATFASPLFVFDAPQHQRQKHEAATNYLGGNRFEGHNTTKFPTTTLSTTRHPLGTNRRDLQTVRDSGRAESIENFSQ